MNDALRSYSRPLGLPKTGKRMRRIGPRRWPRYAAVIGLLLFVYALWISRDSQPMDRFIPRESAYRLYLTDTLKKRGAVLNSPVWPAIDGAPLLSDIPDLFEVDLGLAEWILNNTIGGRSVLFGDDVERFEDAVLVSRMTRVGRIIERLRRFSSSAQIDRAGGLDLRFMPVPEAYYAIRGRTILFSRSRQALIEAVTLHTKESIDRDVFAAAFRGAGVEDLRGVLSLRPDDVFGGYFQHVSFALRVTDHDGRLTVRARLADDIEHRLGPLLEGVSPAVLPAPAPGLASISINFGKPVEDAWTGLGSLIDSPVFDPIQIREWKSADLDGPAPLGPFLAQTLAQDGPAFSVSWTGVNRNEIVPTPAVVARVESQRTLQELVESPGSGEIGLLFDESAGIVTIPFAGGTSLQPKILQSSDGFTFTLGDSQSFQLSTPEPVEDPANLALFVDTREAVAAAVDYGRLLAENGMLKGHTAASFADKADEWTERANRIDEIRVVGRYDDGDVVLNVRVTLPAAPPQTVTARATD